MSTPTDETEELAVHVTTNAEKLSQLLEAIRGLGWGFMPHELRDQLNSQLKGIEPALVESNRLLEAVARETKSARDALIARPYQGLSAAQIRSATPSSDYIAQANAAYQQRMNPALFEALTNEAEKQQAVAAEVAKALMAGQPELKKLAETQREAVTRSLEILALQFSDQGAIMRWLNTELPDLGERTPLQFIREGHADAVETLLTNALAGVPS